MQINKPPEWGARFQFPENVDVSMDSLVAKITEKMACEMVEEYDNFIAESIAKAAREAGVSDCTVLNKKAILEAIEKQIPMVPLGKGRTTYNGYIRYTDYYCPVCGKQQKTVFSGKRTNEGWYCERCGQKLIWRTDNA